MKIEDEYSEKLENSSFLDNLEEAHVIDLPDTMYESPKKVMSLNLAEPYPYFKSLSLVHPELINWDTIEPHNILNFDIFIYLNAVEPSPRLASRKTPMDGSSLNYLSHTKRGQTSQRSSDPNHVVVGLDEKIKVMYLRVKTQLWHLMMR